ncbi:MAG: hypothetical protein HY898_09790 [Deltaproteobacteria bacterium]|nr:hypothetical protein [Deltaproteobacteria bacterium]
MGISELAALLADTNRVGLTPELIEKLKVRPDAVRGQMLAMSDETNSPLGIYIVGVYVIDDTDFWSDGEIYYWTIPVMVDKQGKCSWGVLTGLPTGAAPHSVGSHEWMTSISLKDPPLIAAIPPDPEIDACVIRVAFYDDDGAVADVPKAMTAGMQTLSTCLTEGLSGPDQIITPVRNAIFTSLRAEQDDILIDQDLTIRRGERMNFNVGLIGSLINSMVRVFYIVRDEQRTEQVGPVNLRKGQIERVRFQSKLESGGRVSIFSRGSECNAPAFGDLTTDTPFLNRVLDDRQAVTLADGFDVKGHGPAKLVAYYTPPLPHK